MLFFYYLLFAGGNYLDRDYIAYCGRVDAVVFFHYLLFAGGIAELLIH